MVSNLAEYVEAFSNGGYVYAPFYKSSFPAFTAQYYIDLSMGAGTPKYNAYIGNQAEATQIIGQGNSSLYVGTVPSGRTRYLHKLYVNQQGSGGGSTHIILLDQLMLYPLLDGDSTDAQVMDNTQTLPRYQDGKGVRLMCVTSAPQSASGVCTLNYVNQDGADKTVTFAIVGGTAAGHITNTADPTTASTSRICPFAPLAPGDTGIRSITSITFPNPLGGLFNFVLVYPFHHIYSTPFQASEIEFPKEYTQMKEVKEGASLNFIALASGTVGVTQFNGFVELVNV